MHQGLKNFLYRVGISATRSPNPDAVRALLRTLRPVTIDRPLIRIGGGGDGGYLVPDDLDGLAACFSPGVDVTATFERDLVARGIPCFLADASVAQAPIADPLVDFEKKFVGVVDAGDYVTMDGWVRDKLPDGDGDLLLQMDIEGAEWPVLLNMSEPLLRRCRIIVLELHGLAGLFDPFAFSVITACFERLTRWFHVVHSHPNNSLPLVGPPGMEVPYTLEMTLIRKDRVEATGFATRFPHPLDVECVAAMPPLPLPASLHG